MMMYNVIIWLAYIPKIYTCTCVHLHAKSFEAQWLSSLKRVVNTYIYIAYLHLKKFTYRKTVKK